MGLDFRDLVSKWVWKMTFFGTEIGSGFGELGGTPPPKITRSTPLQGSGAGRKTCWMIHFCYYSRG